MSSSRPRTARSRPSRPRKASPSKPARPSSRWSKSPEISWYTAGVRRLILAAFLLSAAGCKTKTADVAPIAAEDESLHKNESDLMTQRGALQRERKKLAD